LAGGVSTPMSLIVTSVTAESLVCALACTILSWEFDRSTGFEIDKDPPAGVTGSWIETEDAREGGLRNETYASKNPDQCGSSVWNVGQGL
jgi:hypothetical protein